MRRSPVEKLQIHQVVDDYRILPTFSRVIDAFRVPRFDRANLRIESGRERSCSVNRNRTVVRISCKQIRVTETVVYHEAKIVRRLYVFVALETRRPTIGELSP